ncbi:aminoglycoside phosphotransferase family protein [Roseovarius amoyensis]|uniref:aminoglycoside phosphotransferase family protein n=1 Tax=Roseovarius amoyensis TaxID=2211448 RepID=UPI000DBE8BC9|nr:phosphotransferase [Roseovarius amoyensis]
MTDRMACISAFLARAGWSDATIAPLAGDASNRRYLRLTDGPGGQGAVLMDAPPERGEDVRPFIRIAQHLAGLGLSAPAIIAQDTDAGLLLLEDLGDAIFARVLETSPELENGLYSSATDLLAALHDHPLPQPIAAYDPPMMTTLAALAFDWYRLGTAGDAGAVLKEQFCAVLEPLLTRHAAAADVLILRDYHAENLLWLPERTGLTRIGLLDFQDALAGHRAYDLVSLLQDARRDVPDSIESAMLERYIAATGQDAESFVTAYRLLGAQRKLRILGVFARLCLRDGKPRYLDLIPRVWAHLQRDLEHPVLAPLRPILADALPAPTPSNLARLKDQCAIIPTLS